MDINIQEAYMKKSILYMFLYVLLSFTLISCGSFGNTDSSASNTTPDAVAKKLISINVASMGGTEYKFTPNISGAGVSDLTYEWNFGDEGSANNTSTEFSPTHTYESIGMKTITLTTYMGEEVWLVKQHSIEVTQSGSIIGMDIIAKPNTDGIGYTFTTRAAADDGGDLHISWQFNDTEGSDQAGNNLNNVEHTFSQYAKTYTVILTVTNPKTGDSSSTQLNISTPTPTFSFSVTSGAIAGSKLFIPDLSIRNIPNVKYTWYFDTTKMDNSSYIKEAFDDSSVEFYYGTTTGTVDAKCVVSSPNLAQDLEYTYENINIGINFQLFAGYYESTSPDMLTYKYSVKGAFTGTDSDTVSYEFHFADGTVSEKITGTQVTDGGVAVTGQTYAEVTHEYSKYYENYPVKVKAYNSLNEVIGETSAGLSHSFVTPNYTITKTTDGTNPFNVTFVAAGTGNDFYELKGITYVWNVGETNVGEKQGKTVTHEYTSNGTFNVTLTVKSPYLSFATYTVTTTVTVDENISEPDFSCNPKTGDTNWLKYTCTTNATASTGTLYYTWSVDGAVVQEGRNLSTIEHIFPKYGKTYNVGLTIKIDGTSISVTPNGKTVNIPAPIVEIYGNNNVTAGTQESYNMKFRVTRNGESKYIDITDFRSTWNINGSVLTNYYNKDTVPYTFTLPANVNRQTQAINVYVNGSNIQNQITSRKDVTVNKPDPGLEDIQSITLTCNNDSAWNPVKQKCKAKINLKAGALGTTDGFNIIISDSDNLNSITTKDNQEVALTLNWPNINVSGKSNVKQYTITAKVYKDNLNNAKTQTKVVNISNYIYYVLFPLPSSSTGGGTGNVIGVYSCGYNSFYTSGNGVVKVPNCGEKNAASGGVVKGSLDLGGLIDANYQATVRFRMVWGVRINGQEKIIKEGYVDKGAYIDTNLMTFNISSAFSGIKYAGDVYNGSDSGSMFFLRITDAVSKPLTVWYNGNYVKNNANQQNYKLQILAPIQEVSGHSCGYYTSGRTIYAENVAVKFRSDYFTNGSNNFGTYFSGGYTTNTGQSRAFSGSGFASISGQTVGANMLQYTDGDTTITNIYLNSISLRITLKNNMSGAEFTRYENVYKGITCY